MLKENPILPNAFKYKGKCLLEKYKKEEKYHVEKEYGKMMSEMSGQEQEAMSR